MTKVASPACDKGADRHAFEPRSDIEPQIRTVDAALRSRAAKDPDAPFLKCGGRWTSAAELDGVSDGLAAGLAELGIRRGDRVATLCTNREECIELTFASAKLGSILVPLNPFLRGEFLAYQLADSGAKVVVTDAAGYQEVISSPVGVLERIVLLDDVPAIGDATVSWGQLGASRRQAPDVDLTPADLMAIMYTSGTTGLAKGCMLSHGYYTYYAAPWAERGWVIPGDRIFTAFPLFHSGAHMAVMFALMLEGASACIETSFSASTYISRAAEENATCLFGIGVHALAILRQPARPSDGAHPFRIAGFPPMHPDDQDRFEDRFKTPVIAEGIGQTEITPGLLDYVEGPRRRGANGRPCHHVDVELFDEHGLAVGDGEIGELVIRPKLPDAMFSGYWNKPEATVHAWRGLWHHTGDYFTRDAEGFYTFVDRKADALRRRGENISSLQLEEAIAGHPKVAQVAVCAAPSELADIEIKACIIPIPGEEIDPGELFAFLKERLPYFAVPRYVEIRESLPVTPATNRVQKAVLRAEGITPGTWDLHRLGFAIGRDERRG